MEKVLNCGEGDLARCKGVRPRTTIEFNRIPLISDFLFKLYSVKSRVLQDWIRMVLLRLEGGTLYSETLRRIFLEYYDVEIGAYTTGHCFQPVAMDRYTKIGRYCSIAFGARTLNINHPMDFKSTHAFFFNRSFKYCKQDLMVYTPLSIGNDVWLGSHSLILPHVKQIGDGAVIAAGAVVNKDVPPYAIVVGNPARVVRFRFSQEVIDKLLAERWWEKPVGELKINEFTRPFLTRSCPGEINEPIC